jgi:hypothetical protein
VNERKRNLVYAKFHGHCAYCGFRFAGVAEMTIDHIHARSLGGRGVIGNLNPACKSCNSRKGTRDIEWLRGCVAIVKSPLAGVVNYQTYEKLVSMGVKMPPLHFEPFYFEAVEMEAA